VLAVSECNPARDFSESFWRRVPHLECRKRILPAVKHLKKQLILCRDGGSRGNYTEVLEF